MRMARASEQGWVLIYASRAVNVPGAALPTGLNEDELVDPASTNESNFDFERFALPISSAGGDWRRWAVRYYFHSALSFSRRPARWRATGPFS